MEFKIGKYRGCKIDDIVGSDPIYCQWFYRNVDNQDETCSYIENVLNVDAVYMPFGKYKGQLLDDVFSEDKGYIRFLKDSDFVKTKFKHLLKHIAKLEYQHNYTSC